jgi:putative glycosyltransferase (TIGR04372 family)
MNTQFIKKQIKKIKNNLNIIYEHLVINYSHKYLSKNFYKFMPEFALESLVDILHVNGYKYEASIAWTVLKKKEELRLKNAIYYTISTRGIYAFGEFIERIDMLIKSMNLNLVEAKPLKMYISRRNAPNSLFLYMAAEKVLLINKPSKFSLKYLLYLHDKKYLIRPALLKLNGKVYHNCDFPSHLLKMSGYSEDWRIPQHFKEKFNNFLYQLIPKEYILNNKIIALHIPEKNGIHVHRNINYPENYIEAISYLNKIGYYVIRFGRSDRANFGNLGNKYLDISKIDDKPDGFDVYLLSIARFNILGSSGPNFVYYMFNKPSLLLNTFPISYTGLLPQDIYLPKRILINGDEISLRQILNLRLDSPHMSNEFSIKTIENSAEEILYAVKEMINNLNNDSREINEQQNLYCNIIKNYNRLDCGGHISKYFINKYRYLLH